MRAAWDRFVTWWQAHAPRSLEALPAPATEEAIAAAERALGAALPADYRAWLRLHDGGRRTVFVEEVYALAGVVKLAPALREMFGAEVGIPFAMDASCHFLCLDAAGQVVQVRRDTGARAVETASFAAWLARCAERLETGAWVAVDNHGTTSVMRRDVLSDFLVTLRIVGESDAAYAARIALEKRANPGWVVDEIFELLKRYRLVDIADLAAVMGALHGATPKSMHGVLAAHPAVTRLAVDRARILALSVAIPDAAVIRALLGEPPPATP